MDLRDTLHNFRKQCTIDKFGQAALKNNGPGMIMPNDLLDCIIDCAHHGKISTIDQLAKETRWTRLNEYGEDILRLIKAHQRPQDQPVQKTRVCSRCQGTGHIGKFIVSC
jgi:hypothetical protein